MVRSLHERAVGRKYGRHALISCAICILWLQACSSPTRLAPEPVSQTTDAVVIDTPNARFYPDEQTEALFEEGLRSVRREIKTLEISDPSKLPPVNFLALSGGGDDGAFGAGLLVGWSESGDRPDFKLVTGVSTGALIAPFAFLGKKYDARLKEVYTTISAKDIYKERNILGAMFNDALSDTTPLFGLLSRYVDKDMIDAIAREYEKGRLLFIGTTNLDARRPVIWNIGAIAASDHPDAPRLIHKILLASAAIPAAFPPVMVDVQVDGRKYQEMHVDGGAIAQLFLYPPAIGRKMRSSPIQRKRTAYIVRNSKLGADWSSVERNTIDIAGRAITTMIHTSGVNDIFRVYFITQRDGVDFNLAYIGDDFTAPPHEGEFDPAYMRALFKYGYELGRNGYDWQKQPPYFKGAKS